MGYTFRHLTTNNFGSSDDWRDIFSFPRRKNPTRFTATLIAILRTTKNLECIHLGQLDPTQAHALFTALHALRDVHTLSIGQAEERPIGRFLKRHWIDDTTRMLSVVQLARCMARWPALKSLKLHHLYSRTTCIWRFALRPPACRLTQLTISQSHVNDKDLVHLFASSARTLERVVLHRIEGITNVGLLVFLLSISQNVVYSTVQDVALAPFPQWGNLVIGRTERALDVVVDKMPSLRELRIGGDVAKEARVPVVELWLEDVPRLCGFTADIKWPGWCTPDRDRQR